MHKILLKELDFDEAMQLARTDPEIFERYRQYVIDSLIARAPKRNQEHLRRLQWRIDQERERASNPVAACVKLYEMMWESFAGEYGLNEVIHNAHHAHHTAAAPQSKAEVVSISDAAARETATES